jgi:hypothetical protein
MLTSPAARRSILLGSGTTPVETTLTVSITGPYSSDGGLRVPVASNRIVVVELVAVNRNVNWVKVWVAKALLNGAANGSFASDPAETTPVLSWPSTAAEPKES